MKKVLKIAGIVLAVIVVFIAGAIAFITLGLPNIDAPELTIEPTPERLERGEYMVNSVMGCMDCHAQRDWSKFMGPVIEASKGAGGEKWLREYGFPGTLVAPNITPHAIGDWTDGELYRAITAGVSKDGHPLFPIMPYQQYGKLDKEDIYAVIAYIKTLKPIISTTPERELDFPLNIVVHTIPSQGAHELKPDKSDPVAYGKYVITAAACYECHTNQENGQYIENMAYAGGFEFAMETGGVVRSANLTPDQVTGIGNWTKERFIATFKQYQDSTFVHSAVTPNTFNSMMPWTYYATMKEEDLGAIYDYLRSLQPIQNQVVKFTPDS